MRAKKVLKKEVPTGEMCTTCKEIKPVKYRTTYQPKPFCSLDCIAKHFPSVDSKFETFKI